MHEKMRSDWKKKKRWTEEAKGFEANKEINRFNAEKACGNSGLTKRNCDRSKREEQPSGTDFKKKSDNNNPEMRDNRRCKGKGCEKKTESQ